MAQERDNHHLTSEKVSNRIRPTVNHLYDPLHLPEERRSEESHGGLRYRRLHALLWFLSATELQRNAILLTERERLELLKRHNKEMLQTIEDDDDKHLLRLSFQLEFVKN
ncbi:hypothetical protein PFLUV_G00104450 [Perca fluviatilis]|uniref:Uncharacterized protein n=1 Tax=Perca fluviatilis TaxID=8168 RepID=A0A6A5FCS8_PERFL|nr:hypothetical protein PFLUV_G00104450 [Perca fluviatilis]